MFAAALLLAAAAQQQPPPSFRTGVNLVEVDAVVTDRAHAPIRGLKKDDFEVLEDGRPVDIATFVAIDLPADPPDTHFPPANLSYSTVASNDYSYDGRVFLLVLDDFHVRFDARRLVQTKEIARRFIQRLSSADLAAVIATSANPRMAAEFTSDKARLDAAVNGFFPQAEGDAPSMVSGPAERPANSFVSALKARMAMGTLTDAVKTLALIPHRRKAVVLISEGVQYGLDTLMSDSGDTSGVFSALREFVQTAQRNNVTVYPFDPAGLEGRRTEGQENLQSIADGTGGFATISTNDYARGVDRMIAENGTYYLLGYYSPAKPADGKRHKIRVRVKAPGAEVQARDGYVASKRSLAKAAVMTPASIDTLIAAPIQTRGLPMRIAAVPVPTGAAPGTAIAVAVELRTSAVAGAGPIAFSLLAADFDGKVRATDRFTGEFRRTGASQSAWVRLASRLDVEPGPYHVRVAARATNGTQGSVFADVEVPKRKGDVAMGALYLGSGAPSAVAHGDRVAPVVPLVPIATRLLARDFSVSAAVPIEVAPKAAAAPLEIVATVIGADGAARELARESRGAAEFTKPGGQVYALPLALHTMAPGEYRLKIEATLGGRSKASRELPLTIVQ